MDKTYLVIWEYDDEGVPTKRYTFLTTSLSPQAIALDWVPKAVFDESIREGGWSVLCIAELGSSDLTVWDCNGAEVSREYEQG